MAKHCSRWLGATLAAAGLAGLPFAAQAAPPAATTTPTGIQSLNQALLTEEVSMQFYTLNASQPYLTATGGSAGATTGSTTAGTTTGTTAGTTTAGTTTAATTAATTAGTTTAGTTTAGTTAGSTSAGATTAGSTTAGTTAGTTPAAGSLTSQDASTLNSIVNEIKAGHQAHVTMLQQMLGTNAQQMPTFQNLMAPTLSQFLSMAQSLEDTDVGIHQGVILNALVSGNLNPLGSSGTTTAGTTTSGTTTGTTTSGTTTSGTTTGATTGATTGSTTGATTATGTNGGIYGVEVAVLADDASYDGAIRTFEKTISTAEGGNPNVTLTQTGQPLGTGLTYDQGNAALNNFVVGGVPTGAPATTPATGTTTAGTTTSGTTAGTTTSGTTAGTTTAGTTAGTTTAGTTAGTTTAGATTGTTTAGTTTA